MSTTIAPDILFCDYYKQWITTYKEGAIRPVTTEKYSMAHQWVEKLVPDFGAQPLAKPIIAPKANTILATPIIMFFFINVLIFFFKNNLNYYN